MVRELFSGPDKLRICARRIRRNAEAKRQAEEAAHPRSRLQIIQYDAREALYELVKQAADEKRADAPPDRND